MTDKRTSGEGNTTRLTKGATLLELLRELPIQREPGGRLVIRDGKGAVTLESAAGIKLVSAAYGKKFGEAVTAKTVKEAIASYTSADVATIDAGVKVEDDEPSPSQADRLVQLATSQCELFHDEQDVAYVSYFVNDKRETMKLRSSRFQSWLQREFYKTFNKAPGGQAKADAIGVLDGLAQHDGPQRRVSIRVGETDSAIYIDLADDDRTIVEVTPNGWGLVDESPVYFVRPKGLAPLPRPVRGGSVHELRRFLNVKAEHDFVLVVSWLIAAMKPRGPFPILDFTAEHGGGKTSTSRFVRALVDPNVSPVRSAPRELRDLAVAATSAHVLGYDNLSGLPPWLSDGLCRVSTGSGFAARSLYTDAEEQIFEFCRPIILNGIDDIASRADLADRCLVIRLPHIPKERRRREKDLWAKFKVAAPRIFGALLTGLAGALANEDKVVLEELPRMADFAIFATAAESALEWKPGAFQEAYAANLRDSVLATVESDLVATAVVDFMRERMKWSGTATDLLNQLGSLVGDKAREKTWPKLANHFSSRLRRAAPALRSLGFEVDAGDRDAKARLLSLSRCDVAPETPSSPSRASSTRERRGGNDDDDDGHDDDPHGPATRQGEREKLLEDDPAPFASWVAAQGIGE